MRQPRHVDHFSMAGSDKKVPVTIVTGPLGAGKSTLLRYILTERHGLRIAVIENEFAEGIGIESLILKNDVGGSVADGFYELSNGCLCCSVRDSLVETLTRIMAVRHKFDYILVETSGLADPGPVASVFWTDLDDDAPLVLDGIVTVVDAAHFEAQLSRHRSPGAVNEVERQVAFADVLLVNKGDLLAARAGDDAAALAAARASLAATLRRINARARVIETHNSIVSPLTAILDLRTFDPEAPLDASDRGLLAGGGDGGHDCHDAACGHDHHHHHDGGACGHCASADAAGSASASDHHEHDMAVSSLVVRHTGPPLRLAAVKRLMAALLWDHALPVDGAVAAPAPAAADYNGAVAGGAASGAPIVIDADDNDAGDDDDDAPPALIDTTAVTAAAGTGAAISDDDDDEAMPPALVDASADTAGATPAAAAAASAAAAPAPPLTIAERALARIKEEQARVHPLNVFRAKGLLWIAVDDDDDSGGESGGAPAVVAGAAAEAPTAGGVCTSATTQAGIVAATAGRAGCRPYLLQAVHELFDLVPAAGDALVEIERVTAAASAAAATAAAASAAGAAAGGGSAAAAAAIADAGRESKLVVIGTGLGAVAGALERALAGCAVPQ